MVANRLSNSMLHLARVRAFAELAREKLNQIGLNILSELLLCDRTIASLNNMHFCIFLRVQIQLTQFFSCGGID